MRLDLTADREDITVPRDDEAQRGKTDTTKSWLAHPKTLRLTTRPRPPRDPDGSRPRVFSRISRSCQMPLIVFSVRRDIEDLAKAIVNDSLLPLFHQLHPEKSGWNLSLVNLCATNMAVASTESKDGIGRDIGRMFRQQDEVLKGWKILDADVVPPHRPEGSDTHSSRDANVQQQPDTLDCSPWNGPEDTYEAMQDSNTVDDTWYSEAEAAAPVEVCKICGVAMPLFAMAAHQRFHSLPD